MSRSSVQQLIDISVESLSTIRGGIIVKVYDKRNSTESGIILPVTSNNAFCPDKGEVIHVNKENNMFDLSVGDKVVFEKFQGQRLVDLDGNIYIIMSQKNVLALLDKDADITFRNS